MTTPYQNIARAALMNWNGLSAEEANYKIQNETVEQLENQIGALPTIEYCVLAISELANLTDEETISFHRAIVNGPENSEIFNIVSEKTKNFTDELKLDALSIIHDGWVINNSNEKTFNKKVERQQLRQYTPLELIGWNEVKSDLLFLNPILNSIGVNTSEKELELSYYNRVIKYMDKNNINNQNDLLNLISKGKEYYSILPDDLNMRLLPMSNDISEQVIQNWFNKNPEVFQIFESRDNIVKNIA